MTSQLPAVLIVDSAHGLHHGHYVVEILIQFLADVLLVHEFNDLVPQRLGEQRGSGLVHGRDGQPASLVDDLGRDVRRQQRVRQPDDGGQPGAHLLLSGPGQQHARGRGQHVEHVRALDGREDLVDVLADRADHPGRFRTVEHQPPLVFDVGEPGLGHVRVHRGREHVGKGLLHLAVRDDRLSATRQVLLHLGQPLAGIVLKFVRLGFFLVLVVGLVLSFLLFFPFRQYPVLTVFAVVVLFVVFFVVVSICL